MPQQWAGVDSLFCWQQHGIISWILVTSQLSVLQVEPAWQHLLRALIAELPPMQVWFLQQGHCGWGGATASFPRQTISKAACGPLFVFFYPVHPIHRDGHVFSGLSKNSIHNKPQITTIQSKYYFGWIEVQKDNSGEGEWAGENSEVVMKLIDLIKVFAFVKAIMLSNQLKMWEVEGVTVLSIYTTTFRVY